MKKIRGRREGINKTGCMWMFINIFGSNQKRLLMDNNKQVSVNEKKKLLCSCESSQESVEKLIEEEMLGKKKDIGHVEIKVSNDESEENLSEIIKRLIAHKEGEIQTCKDLLDAFHVLKSKEEPFLKKISHQDSNKAEQEALIISKKKGNFFRRKWRLQERRDISQVAKTIVVLKPSSGSSTGNKSKTRRSFSRFLIGLIKRRLHSNIGKKSCDVAVNRRSQRCCNQEDIQSKPEKHVSDEEGSYIVHESEDSKKTMSSLYIAAKKHLSEMLANGDIDVNLPDREVPRILGKILSLPEFSSPTDSPRLISGHDLASQTTEKPKILDQDSDKQDETLFTIDISVPRDEEEIDPTSSLTESQTSCSVTMSECKETTTDVQGKLSPASVLEPQFTDDDISPTTTTRFTSAKARLQPLCIRFEEPDSPKQENANNVKTSMDDERSTLAYIETVVKASSLSYEKLLTKHEHLLDPAEDDIFFFPTELCDDKNLLHDCINEVLMDFCANEFNPGPWLLFLKPELQLISEAEMIAAKVAREGVYWHLLPLPFPHTLDQMVRKDMARDGSWMDVRVEIGCIGTNTGEMILDELVEEIIRSYRDMV